MPKQHTSKHPSHKEPKGTRMKKVAEREAMDIPFDNPPQKELKAAKEHPASGYANSEICLMCLDSSF